MDAQQAAQILANFTLEGEFIQCPPVGNGLINDTFAPEFRLADGSVKRFLLQRINTYVFKNPDALMENVVAVTAHVKNAVAAKGGDTNRECMTVYPTVTGASYYKDEQGDCWRVYNYIEDTFAYQSAETPQVAYLAAKSFGEFQRMVADFPIEQLHDTIPDFHNTPKRYENLEQAVKENRAGRLQEVEAELAFARAHKADTERLLDLHKAGKLPLRVTHNDTKLNNVLFDNATGEGLCVVDLDTVMPGLSLYDFGDSIRFNVNTADENDRDLDHVKVNLPCFEAYAKGFLEAAGKSLTPEEVAQLAFSGKLMALECGMRFLTDYLDGDVYFKIKTPDANLMRCRNQFRLVAELEAQMETMEAIVDNLYRELV